MFFYFNGLNKIYVDSLFNNRTRRRKKKRRRGKHLYSLFLSRKKKYSLYYQPFDSRLVNKNIGSNINAPYSNLKRKKFRIGIKALKLNLIRIICLKGMKFCSQRYLRSVYLDKYFKFNISVFPDYWMTAKPKSVRMGKGKGDLKFKVFFLRKGTDLYNFRYLKNFNSYIINNKLFLLKFNMFVFFLMKILKSKPSIQSAIYKKLL